MIRLTFLLENKTDTSKCKAEHGLSVYIETLDKKILFDTGASDLFIENTKNLKVDLKDVEDVVISHGHYDHTGGVPAFCEINDNASIYIHKEAFEEMYGTEDGVLDEEPCSILWDDKTKENIIKRVVFTDGVHKISEDIIISGTILDVEGVEPTETFYIKKVSTKGDVEFVKDEMKHEQFLAIRDRNEDGTSKGIYVFSGCSHKGVIPVLRYVKELFPGEKLLGLIAGMHLYSADKETRDKVINEILKENIEMVMPVHCTGIKAICELKTIMGEKCIVATAGAKYEL